jgi:hydroxymethylglutaryl-CoA lyase
MKDLFITECPRDAMQGIHDFIPTALKIKYLNVLLKVGFDRLDFGSFVSPKAIPQLKDTAEVLGSLELSETKTRLLAIIANERGAAEACNFEQVSFLGFPLSVSETFQKNNTNTNISEAFRIVEQIQARCLKSNKKMLVYLSMAFGNPYGDAWSHELVIGWAKKLEQAGIKYIALADTIGSSTPAIITDLFTAASTELSGVEVGAHLHSVPGRSIEKIEAAYNAGCRRFDVAIHGFGGCPMAKEELTGNVATEDLLDFMHLQNVPSGLHQQHLSDAYATSWEIFSHYH